MFGTHASFVQGPYEPLRRCGPVTAKHDVVMASAFACHLPDPLNFLAYMASLANEAIFLFDQVIDTEALIVAYDKPRDVFGHLGPFPYRFNEHTRLSKGLLYHAFEELGFPNIVEIPWDHEWLTASITRLLEPPPAMPETRQKNWRLGAEFGTQAGSRHRAILAMR